MDFYIEQISEHSVHIATIGVVVAMYLMMYLSWHDTTSELESNRIIRSIAALLEGHMNSLKVESKFENPYDLFTHIYPSLRDMENDRIDELVTLIDNYNKNWIDESD
jgi:hypothetical protein